MKKRTFSKILAVLGTILVWLPIVAPVVFGFISLMGDGRFRFDYFLPAEYALLIIAGGAALLWAAIRERLLIKWIAWSFGLALACLGGCMGAAAITGLASGRVDENGWQMMLTLGLLIGYILMAVLLGIGGICLETKIFRRQ